MKAAHNDTDSRTGRPIAVGVDGSHSSQRALQWSAGIFRATGVGIDAVFAWELPKSLGWQVHAWQITPHYDATAVLARIVDNAFGSHRPADLRLITEGGGGSPGDRGVDLPGYVRSRLRSGLAT